MFITASSSSHIASSTPLAAAANESTVATSTQPTLSSRDPAKPSLLPPRLSLHGAAENGDLDLMAKLLTSTRSDANAQDPVSGLRPLTCAIRGNRPDAIRMLLEAGAKPYACNRDGSIPLVYAASGNNVEAVQLLLDHGADVDQTDGDGMTALRSAVFIRSEKMAGLLLDRGADINQLNTQDQTLLFDAIALRQPSMIALLLDRGIDIEHVDQQECTALCHAVRLGHMEETGMLLARGAEQAHSGRLLGTPVMIAARNGNAEVLGLLMTTHNVYYNMKDEEGNTALHLAANSGHEAAVDLLLRGGASTRPQNRQGDTPLAVAARAGHLRTMIKLLDAELVMALADENIEAVLSNAVSRADFPVVALLLERGVYFDYATMALAQHPLTAEMLLHARSLKPMQADDTLPPPFDGSVLMEELLATTIENKNEAAWRSHLIKHRVSTTLSSALTSAASTARLVWKSLAGEGQKVTPAQQKNWCAGIFADLVNVMQRESPYASSGLTPATRSVLEKISTGQVNAVATAALAAEQPLRDGMTNLLQTCMKAVSDDQFHPKDLYKVLTREHGVYHHVASLIVSAFADVWARRDSLGSVKLEQAFAAKLASLKASRKTLQAMNSTTAAAGNQATATMLMFRQLDLLQAWMDKAGAQ